MVAEAVSNRHGCPALAEMGDRDLSSSQGERRLSLAEVRGLNKAQLIFELRSLIDEPNAETEAGPGTVQMARIERKLDDIVTHWNTEKEAMQK